MEKHWFFTLFARHRVKRSKTLFFCIITNFCFSRKTWKNTVFKHCFHLLRIVAHKSQENAVFRILWEFRTKCLERREKTLFSNTFLQNFAQKAQKMLFFRIFEKLCRYKLSRRTWKNTFFSYIFLGMLRKKLKELCFSHFLRTLYKIARKTWKNTVFPHFLWDVAQKSQKTLFFTFFANFIQSVSKDVKNTVF